MKRNSHICLYFLLLLFAVSAILPACKKDLTTNSAPPSITSVRLYNPSPKDTLLSTGDAKTDPSWSIKAGRYVVILGQNLQNATQISINGVPANFNPTLFAPGSAVVQIPDIQFSTVDTAKLYMLQYTTQAGSTTFSFKLGPEAPIISAISDVFAAPGDSVYIYGSNLVLVQNFQYGGTEINSFKYNAWGTALGFLMPATISSKLITIITKSGTAIDTINAKPTIIGVSYEHANPGDSVYIYGTYLKNLQSLTYSGTEITSFVSSKNGSWVGFVLPTLTQSGPVSLTTSFGSITTEYNVNDYAGIIANMEWSSDFGWSWNGGSLVNNDAIFYGITKNTSQYVVMNTPVLKAGEGNAGWPPTYAMMFNGGNRWVPTANVADNPGNWALKFDISVPKAWNGGALNIVTGIGGFIARWEPWQISATKTAPFTTKGWITVTVPFSSFRAKDGTLGEGMGAPLSKIVDLIGVNGNPNWTVYIHNYNGSATSTGFKGAFDNFRVVKIK